MAEVYSPVFETYFNIVFVYEDKSGNPLLICENKEKGFKRMIFRPLEVSCYEKYLWKGQPVEFYKGK